ncbi:TPA: hypothetical protein QCY19_003995 [Bacillus luti]|nr:hypothetical protein [Bacillus luti]
MNEKFYFVSYMWGNAEAGISWTPGHTVIKEHPSEWYGRVKWKGNEDYRIISFQSISKEEYENFEVIL